MDTGVSLKLGGGVKRPQRLAFNMKPGIATKPAAFAAESDDEDHAEAAAKKQRSTPADASAAAAPHDEVRKVADKLAEFVAKNGRSFEDVTRSRNTADGPFSFLFEKASADYQYYEHKVEELQRKQSGSQASAAPPIPPPPPPPSHPPPPHSPPLPSQAEPTGTASPQHGRGDTERHRAKKALAEGDSLAAMEAFANMARRHEEGKEELESRVEHLNETSFDRRRKVAVYKSDGRRGHHMQDFIPPEELAALLAKSGDPNAAAQAAALEKSTQLGSDNIGHKLLAQMGWREGQGLGANAGGIAAPVAASGTAGASEKRGLGAKAHGEVEEGDDAFEVYRKRMMLGYKHRPNPLGNPRKAYY